jgi:dihydrofolate reductase
MIAIAEAIMRRLGVFNTVSVDGFFTDAKGGMSWAHNAKPDAEWDAFVGGNASGGGMLLFGRITYDLMASFWPTPMAAKQLPTVAEGMNRMPKGVFSRTMDTASWINTKVLKGDLATEVRKLKSEPGPDMVILGSGSIVSQLAPEGVIDEYQIVTAPLALGAGRTMFDGVKNALKLSLTKTRSFANGNVVSWYEPTA